MNNNNNSMFEVVKGSLLTAGAITAGVAVGLTLFQRFVNNGSKKGGSE